MKFLKRTWSGHFETRRGDIEGDIELPAGRIADHALATPPITFRSS